MEATKALMEPLVLWFVVALLLWVFLWWDNTGGPGDGGAA